MRTAPRRETRRRQWTIVDPFSVGSDTRPKVFARPREDLDAGVAALVRRGPGEATGLEREPADRRHGVEVRMVEVGAAGVGVDRVQAQLAGAVGAVAGHPDGELRARVVPLDVPVADRALGQDLRVAAAIGPVRRGSGARSWAPRSRRRRRLLTDAVPPRGGLAAGADGRAPHRAVVDEALAVVREVQDRRPGRAVDDAADEQATAEPAGQLRPVVGGHGVGLAVADVPHVDVGAVRAVGRTGGERELRPVRASRPRRSRR